MNKVTVRFSYPTLPDLTPRGVKRMFFQAGYAVVDRMFQKTDRAYALSVQSLQQSANDYHALESQLASLNMTDLALAAKNRAVTVAGYELLATDGFQVIEWAILDAEYARLNIEQLTADVNRLNKARRIAESRRYMWQVLRDRA